MSEFKKSYKPPVTLYEINKEIINDFKKRSVVQELIDKQEKYRWHDLRNDADDLPRENTNCLVLLNDYQYTVSKYFKHETFGGVWNCEAYDYWVLAWKYIEEFKDE